MIESWGRRRSSTAGSQAEERRSKFLGVKYLNWGYFGECMQETILINREAVKDLLKVKEEFDAIVESIELMSDKEFMNSYNKSKEQIKKREFADWNAL